tara:strand:+ start:49 stop:591 length:543 start_codon:yes stop_codon:yes gene_type:complete
MIEIYDDLIPKRIWHDIYAYLRYEHGWHFSNDDYTENGGIDRKAPVTLGSCKEFDEFEIIPDFALLNILEKKFGDVSRISRNLTNCFRKNDNPQYHQDSTATFNGKKDRTFIFYPNLIWHEDWGAGTKFKIPGEKVKTIYPKPGRLVVFDGDIWHTGTRCTKKMPDYIAGRFSIAFQETS